MSAELHLDDAAAWKAWRDRALAALDLHSIYGQWVAHPNQAHRSAGYVTIHDPFDPDGDKSPSAGYFASSSGPGDRGHFHSFRTDETFSVFDFMVKTGAASDFANAKSQVADSTGVPLPHAKKNGAMSPDDLTALKARDAAEKQRRAMDQMLGKQFRWTLDEFGNADRFLGLNYNTLRFCVTGGPGGANWLHYESDSTGSGWKWSDQKAAMLARKSLESIATEIDAVDTPGDKMAVLKWHNQCRSARAVTNVLQLARCHSRVQIAMPDLDAHPHFLNTRYEIVDLRDGFPVGSNPEHLQTKSTSTWYNRNAGSDLWYGFLQSITLGNRELIDYLQLAVGYSAWGHSHEKKAFFCWGDGDNGKSTFFAVIAAILGDYAAKAPPELLMQQRPGTGTGIPNDLAMLAGKRFVYVSETEKRQFLNVARLKEMTSLERVTARFLHHEFFEYLPQFTVWLGTNHKPRLDDTGAAVRRRLVMLPFLARIPKEQQDRNLITKLSTGANADAVLAWIVAGAVKYHANPGCLENEPAIVRSATDDYLGENETNLWVFIDSAYERDAAQKIPVKAFLTEYLDWCNHVGEDSATDNTRTLIAMLRERGYKVAIGTGGARFVMGLKPSSETAFYNNNDSGVI